jgi:hypothetical protein
MALTLRELWSCLAGATGSDKRNFAMQGQWLGSYSGTNKGEAIVELDDVGDHYEGKAYVFDDQPQMPSTLAYIALPKGTSHHKADFPLKPLNPISMDLTEWQHLAPRFPGVTFPDTAHTEWTLSNDKLKVSWTTNIGTSGEAELSKVDGSRPSELEPLGIITWDDFRKYVRTLPAYKFMFRGQGNNKWRLRTSFHRSKRADLLNWLQNDIAALHQHLSNLTPHFFNLTNPLEHAAFISLVQHHGYPTPLLDWTYSPFIAAWFAFKYPDQNASHVRILIFDRQLWRADWNQVQKIVPARLHFSVLDAIALNNPRMIPQQALSTVTNSEDIEDYINRKANERPGRKYLHAIDLPVDHRNEVLAELSSMGITAGSMFPGLDGACNQLKDRLFGF